MLYDEDRLGGKGLHKCLKLLGEKLAPRVVGLKCEQQEEIDREVEKGFVESGGQGAYVVTCLSYLPLQLRSHLLATPPYALVAQQSGTPRGKHIKTMINCLQGGKAIGSKCKVFKYYIVAKQVADPSLLQAALQGVRKAIVGGKGGEAALKLSPDGTFVCPLDTIADNLKIIE
jgi:enolase